MADHQHHHRKYKKIAYSDRIKLIEKVCEEGISCAAAAKELRLSPSTAKMIVKVYKESGRVFEKKEDKAKRVLS